ncbi:FtsW/RodA/SpoVE family cell cycle protein [Agathobaculum sp. Marseille-P7918]|uniref:FtsW/RodA/SpoVE family cell cycle protein n=1 Tax=Agathobaculum sp. Marseille-P7918 TaxID=2479843 RepID=UPI0035639893
MDVFKTVTHYIKNTDLYLVILALVCSGYGMVLIYSATLNPVTVYDGSTRNLIIQGAAVIIGLGAFVVMSLIDLEGMSGWWKIFVLVNIGLQFLLFTPLGMEVNGQRAWLDLGVTSLQPGELGKLIFIFTLAAHISEIKDHISEWRGLFVIGLHTLIMMGAVVIASGDTGMAIQYFMIALIMLFAAGLSLKWLGAGLGLGIISIPIIWNFILKDYQKTRILVLFDPSIDPDASMQSTYGKIAIGSGQLSGQGLTHGTMTQMQMVSENQTDYIFSVAGEELGFIGCMLIICLLGLLILRLFYVSYRASTTFSALLAVGVGGMFLFQTFMNIFMNVGLLPVMGLTLPFFSYGGTSVVTMYAALGIAAGVRMREKPSWLQ